MVTGLRCKPLGKPPGKPLGKTSEDRAIEGRLTAGIAGKPIDGTAGGKGIDGEAMDGIAMDGGLIEGTMLGRLGRDGIATGSIATGTDGIATGGIATGIDGIARGTDGIATGIDGTATWVDSIAIGIDNTATGRDGAAGRLGRLRDGNIGISGGMAIRVRRGEVRPIAEDHQQQTQQRHRSSNGGGRCEREDRQSGERWDDSCECPRTQGCKIQKGFLASMTWFWKDSEYINE